MVLVVGWWWVGGSVAHQMDSVTLRLEAYLPASEFH